VEEALTIISCTISRVRKFARGWVYETGELTAVTTTW
jgi:hypothetical protein